MLFFPNKPLGEDIIVFTTSVHGGVSEGQYHSLNVGAHVGDNPRNVDKNRQVLLSLIAQQLGGLQATAVNMLPINWLNQQHTTKIVDAVDYGEGANLNNSLDNNEACDGIFTTRAMQPLAIMTADCLPLVFYCPQTKMLSAIHAGWRGLIDGIVGNAIDIFNYPKKLQVWIGPSISAANFQITSELLPDFKDYSFALSKITAKKTDQNQNQNQNQRENISVDRYSVDLRSIAIEQLRQGGVANIQCSEVCTYDSKDCFSHRRSQHQGLSLTGRMATIILRLSAKQ